MRLKVIACEVVARELYWCAARARHAVNLTLLEQGLHANSDLCRTRLQQEIDAAGPDRFDAVLLGYGLCNNSLVGARAGRIPLVVPRAHDCITLLVGSKERYARRFAEAPGTYWFSSGWLESYERGGERIEPRSNSGLGSMYKAESHEELVAKYGVENARYLTEFMSHWEDHYTRGALIQFEFDRHLGLEDKVRRICEEKGWEFVTVPGDLGLLESGLNGEWDAERFVTVTPGEVLRASYTDGILATEAGDDVSGSGMGQEKEA